MDELFKDRGINLLQRVSIMLEEEINVVNTIDGFDSVEEYIDRFLLHTPVLGYPTWSKKDKDKIKVGRESFIRNCSPDTLLSGKTIVCTIPFTGDKEIFLFRPNKHILSGPVKCELTDNSIIMSFDVITYGTTPESVIEKVEKGKKELISSLEKWIPFMEADCKTWNSNLKETIEKHINRRKQEIKTSIALDDAIDSVL